MHSAKGFAIPIRCAVKVGGCLEGSNPVSARLNSILLALRKLGRHQWSSGSTPAVPPSPRIRSILPMACACPNWDEGHKLVDARLTEVGLRVQGRGTGQLLRPRLNHRFGLAAVFRGFRSIANDPCPKFAAGLQPFLERRRWQKVKGR